MWGNFFSIFKRGITGVYHSISEAHLTSRTEPYTADELRIWRARERLTQARVAKLFEASQRSISHWEAGDLPKDFSDRFERVLVDYYNVAKEEV